MCLHYDIVFNHGWIIFILKKNFIHSLEQLRSHIEGYDIMLIDMKWYRYIDNAEAPFCIYCGYDMNALLKITSTIYRPRGIAFFCWNNFEGGGRPLHKTDSQLIVWK